MRVAVRSVPEGACCGPARVASPLPAEFEYVGWDAEADIALLHMYESGSERRRDVPTVLWVEEMSWLCPYNMHWDGTWKMSNFHDDGPQQRYMALFGTHLRGPTMERKTVLVNAILTCYCCPKDPRRKWTWPNGYAVRHAIHDMLGHDWEHGFGRMFGKPFPAKDEVLNPTMFSITVESEDYPWAHTEKIFDCFAARTVPIYWGCRDLSKLSKWGFDISGVLPVYSAEAAVETARSVTEEMYLSMTPAIETNFKRAWQLPCNEAAFIPVFEEILCLA